MLLGVGGELESGKSTVAGVLVNKYGFTEKSFAKNLKEMCKSVVGLTEYDVNDTQGKKTPFKEPIVFNMEHIAGIIKWASDKNGVYVDADMLNKMKAYLGKILTTPREVLQFVGTEICRQCIIDSYHIDVVEREIELEKLDWVVVSDARFSNERAWVHSKCGFTILAYNPHAEKKTGNVHLSEQVGNPADYDYTIVNDKTLGLRHLYKAVHMVMHMLEVKDAKFNYIEC